MSEKGLNIPDYVENPYAKHKDNTLLFLKEVFFGYPFVTFLSEKDGDYKDYDNKNLSNVLLDCMVLEQDGYLVWVAEGVECEYVGTIWLWQDGSGRFKCNGSRVRNYKFLDFETIKDVKERIIVRRVHSFLEQTDFQGVQMDFGWSTSFLGKLNEKIVFFDFGELKKNA